jgi:serine/threonine protein phosphatase 1
MRRFTYAIGDIHGRLDLLNRALGEIAARGAGAERLIVCLGDYVDRGPESAGVVGRLRRGLKGSRLVCLKGNHEAMMLDALANPHGRAMDFWRSNGGEETLDSYGGVRSVPFADLEWLDSLPHWWSDAHRDYVHAGIEPGLPMPDQDPAALIWIRDRFLDAPPEAFERHIVHGHTPRWRGKPDPASCELLPHRTNLDSGAWASGVLSVGVFDPDRPGGPLEVLRVR